MFRKHKHAKQEREETKRELDALKNELAHSNMRADTVLEKLRRRSHTLEPRLKIVKVK